MKNILALLVFAAVHTATFGADETLYGGWWDTYTASPGAPKFAGGMVAVLFDAGNAGANGPGEVRFDVDDVDAGRNPVTYHYTGTWTRSGNGKFLLITIPTTSPNTTSFAGKLNLANGQLTGNYKTGSLYRGKVQATRANVTLAAK